MTIRSLYLAALLAFALFAASAVAQNDAEPHHSFGCSSTRAESTFSSELNHPSKLRLVAVTDQQEIQRVQAAAFHTLYSKIDSSKYKISRVEFYVRQNRGEGAESGLPYAPVVIYVKLTSAEQVLWSKILPAEDEDTTSRPGFLVAQLPNDGSEPVQSPVVIVPATGDRTIPLFDLLWNRLETGVWVGSHEEHLLLDLRSAQPAIAADLSCDSYEAFGACGVYDAQDQENNNYECDWIPADADFGCEATTWNPIQGKRQTKSWFHLLSDKEIPFVVPPGSPATLQEFAKLAEHDSGWRTRQVELPGLGKTAEILRVSGSAPQTIHVFGTYGDKAPFGARFFSVILSEGPPVIGYLPALSLFASDPEGKNRHMEFEFERRVEETQSSLLPTNQIETGTALSFRVKEVFTESRTRIFQVTATEDDGHEPQSQSHAVYWLAIDQQQPGGKPLLSMAKLASDVAVYQSCARYHSEDSAASISLTKGSTFQASIDVEPWHTTDERAEGFLPPDENNGEVLEDQCPYSVHVSWDHKEWVSDKSKPHCASTFSPRVVEISDDGTITNKPGKVEKSDSE